MLKATLIQFLVLLVSLVNCEYISNEFQRLNNIFEVLSSSEHVTNSDLLKHLVETRKVDGENQYDNSKCLDQLEIIRNGLSNSEWWAFESNFSFSFSFLL